MNKILLCLNIEDNLREVWKYCGIGRRLLDSGFDFSPMTMKQIAIV